MELFVVAILLAGPSVGIPILMNQMQKFGVFPDRKRNVQRLDPETVKSPRALAIGSLASYSITLLASIISGFIVIQMILSSAALFITGHGDAVASEAARLSSQATTAFTAAWFALAVAVIAHIAAVVTVSPKSASQD